MTKKEIIVEIKNLKRSIKTSGHRTYTGEKGLCFIDELLDEISKQLQSTQPDAVGKGQDELFAELLNRNIIQECCAGCHKPYNERDCGCPAGSYIRINPNQKTMNKEEITNKMHDILDDAIEDVNIDTQVYKRLKGLVNELQSPQSDAVEFEQFVKKETDKNWPLWKALTERTITAEKAIELYNKFKNREQ